ncbi:MAG TPA: zinc ribbon domain-containing protein [Acidobacteriota bacterium]
MGLISCPECRHQVSDKAATCPGCGHPLKPEEAQLRAYAWRAYEYKSKVTIFGLPLIHIVSGPSWAGGGLKPAKGIIAIGNVAIGVFALGGVALGGVALGGIGMGIIGLGGLALGLFVALGGGALGYIAIGGLAVGVYSVGGLSIGLHTIYNDPEFLEKIRHLFGFF